jgi:hypothetical protein
MIEINIRLDGGGRRYTDQQFANREKGVVAMLSRLGAVEHRVRRLWRDQPRHLVAQVHVDSIPDAALFAIAKKFRQACLSIYSPDRNEGRLVGPDAAEWGPFDLTKFERFDDTQSINPVKRSGPSPKYVPSEDPDVEKAKMEAMYARLRQVFTQDVLSTFAPQQINLTDNAIYRALEKDGPDALTVPRFEGIYELVTEHLWSPALTAVFNTANKSGVHQ